MATAVMGFLGALAAAGLLGGGVFLGWRMCENAGRRRLPPDNPDGRARRRLREEQAAFQRLQNYNAEDAYGMGERM